MVKRPKLTDVSFLGHIFSPKKHALPTGIRKTTLKGKKGQSKGRIAAFNRMAPVKQEMLKRSGTRDSYLRGETSLADAKNALRPSAIAQKLARPLRAAKTAAKTALTALDIKIAHYFSQKLRDNGKDVNLNTVNAQLPFMGDQADQQMLSWDVGEIKHAGRKGSEYEIVDERGVTHNPFWYH